MRRNQPNASMLGWAGVLLCNHALSFYGVRRTMTLAVFLQRLRAELDSYYSTPVSAPDDLSRVDETQWFRRIFQAVSVHDIASVIKQFLRDLPQPLLTNELVDAFIQVAGTNKRTVLLRTSGEQNDVSFSFSKLPKIKCLWLSV